MGASVLIIGIDGATPDLMGPWIEDGHLPHLGRLAQNGCHGNLITTYPPITAPAWTSFMTGCNPGKHGVYDFLTRDVNAEGVVDARSIRAPTIWRILSDAGRSIGLVNVPVTFPPSPLNGVVITGMLSSSDPDRCAHPAGLIQDIERATGATWWERYRNNYAPSRPAAFIEGMHRSNRDIAAFCRHLLNSREFDVFMVVFNVVDGISHFFWHCMDPEHPAHTTAGGKFSDAIRSAYKLADELTGELLDTAGAQTDVVLMSDHGFGPLEGMVNLNNFLAQQGYLSLKKGGSSGLKRLLRRMGVTPRSVMKLVEKFGLDWVVRKVPKTLRNRVIGTMGSYSDIDWTNTVCYSRGHMGQLYLTEEARRDPETRDRWRERIIKDLSGKLVDPQTGAPLLTRALTTERMYEGPWTDRAPDIFLIMKDWRYIAYPLFSSGSGIVTPHIQRNRYGNHRMNGIFCGCGPSFRRSDDLADHSIMDLAPTLLYLLRSPIPSYMDGRLMEEALTAELLDSREAEYEDRELPGQKKAKESAERGAEERDRQERLRALGYLE